MTKKQTERMIAKLIAQLEKQYGKVEPPDPTEEPMERLIMLVLLERTTGRKAERAAPGNHVECLAGKTDHALQGFAAAVGDGKVEHL